MTTLRPLGAYSSTAELYLDAQELQAQLEESEKSFELRWQADMRAILRWQEATNRTQVWPDHADLCVWLLEQLEAERAAWNRVKP